MCSRWVGGSSQWSWHLGSMWAKDTTMGTSENSSFAEFSKVAGQIIFRFYVGTKWPSPVQKSGVTYPFQLGWKCIKGQMVDIIQSKSPQMKLACSGAVVDSPIILLNGIRPQTLCSYQTGRESAMFLCASPFRFFLKQILSLVKWNGAIYAATNALLI